MAMLYDKLSKKRLPAYGFCLVCAALIMMLCTKSSFLYPLNDWEDANILFTLGRGMMAGKTPFVDLYDQKGPFAYLLYGLASLISNRSFIGLYVLETLCFSGFLYGSWRTIGLFEKKNALFTLPVLGALVASAMSFTNGGSVEELCLPALAFSLFDVMRYYRCDHPYAPMPYWRLLIHGVLAGCVLWTKYTILGFYIAWILVLFLALMIDKQIGRAFVSVLVFLGGMIVATLPWLLYFGGRGALNDMFQYYFIYNICGYSAEEARSLLGIVLNMGKNTLATFYRNAQYSVLIALGVLYITLCRNLGARRVEKWNIWALCVLSCMGIYVGTQGYRYYGVVLAVFACLGVVPLLKLCNRYLRPLFTRAWAAAVPPVLLAASLALCPLLSDNAYLLGTKKDALPQYRFAAAMEENRRRESVSLLSYQMMDSGFYLTAGYEPGFRCFTRLNIAQEEILAAQNGYLDEGLVEFVVTEGEPLERGDYTLLDEAAYWYEDAEQHYYLYQRNA